MSTIPFHSQTWSNEHDICYEVTKNLNDLLKKSTREKVSKYNYIFFFNSLICTHDIN